MLRVIAGEARSVPLATVDTKRTRPTTDRIKETLFNIVQSDVSGARFLDLFAGSGQIGIEALSRGADFAVFAEGDRKCIDAIEYNLNKTRLKDKSLVLFGQIPAILKRLHSEEPFDLVFIDPPYDMTSGYTDALMSLVSYNLVTKDSLVICECAKTQDLEQIADECGFSVTRIKDYKTNRHYFMQIKE